MFQTTLRYEQPKLGKLAKPWLILRSSIMQELCKIVTSEENEEIWRVRWERYGKQTVVRVIRGRGWVGYLTGSKHLHIIGLAAFLRGKNFEARLGMIAGLLARP